MRANRDISMRWSRRKHTSADVAELMKRNRTHVDRGLRVAKRLRNIQRKGGLLCPGPGPQSIVEQLPCSLPDSNFVSSFKGICSRRKLRTKVLNVHMSLIISRRLFYICARSQTAVCSVAYISPVCPYVKLFLPVNNHISKKETRSHFP